MIVQLFNFSHDIALARGAKVFTPPTVVRAMERDLQPLRNLLPQPFRGYTPDAPVWGWDEPLVHSLKKAGYPPGNTGSSLSHTGYQSLPTTEHLAAIRALSSRRTAVLVLKQLRQRLSSLPLVGESLFLTSPSDLQRVFPQQPANTSEKDNPALPSPTHTNERDSPAPPHPTHIIKEPYSSSGRGLRPVSTVLTPKTRQWALRCIREQGGVEVEPYYNKVMDLAMEFTCTEAGITYDGLSVFLTRANNTYTGNIVAHQDFLEGMAGAYIDRAVLHSVRNALTDILSPILIGKYLGPVGVDMMVVQTNGTNTATNHKQTGVANQTTQTNHGYALHPCVEINLRRTMGNLALYMTPLLTTPTATAIFRILYSPNSLENEIAALESNITASESKISASESEITASESETSALRNSSLVRLLTPVNSASQFAAVLIPFSAQENRPK